MVSTSDLQKWQTTTTGINESGQTDLIQEEWAALITLNGSLQNDNFESDESLRALTLLKNNLSRHSNNHILQIHLQNFIALCEQYADTTSAKITTPIGNVNMQPAETPNATTNKINGGSSKKWIIIIAAIVIGYLVYSNWESLSKMSEAKPTSVVENKELLAEIIIGGKIGCINQKGELVIPAIYYRMGIWSEGMASVMLSALEEKIGFINTKGREVIPLIYDLYYLELMPFFSEGIVPVNKKNAWGFIDKTGKEIIPFIYHYAVPFREGLAAVKNRNGKWGFIDKSGNKVIECNYESATSFSEGLAIVNYKSYMSQFDNWQIIDMAGNEIKKIYNRKYYSTGVFSEGMSAVLSKKNRSYFNDEFKYGFIDTAGKEVIPLKYDYYVEGDYLGYPYFSEGLARVSKGKDSFVLKYGFVDKAGIEVIPLKYDYVTDFTEGLAVVMLNDKYGFIDQNGKEVIPLIYDRVCFDGGFDRHICFREGLAAVQKDEKWGFIDRTGKTVIPFQYDYANDFYEGLAYTSEGFIDKTAKVVISKSLLQTYSNEPIDFYSLGNFVNVKKRK